MRVDLAPHIKIVVILYRYKLPTVFLVVLVLNDEITQVFGNPLPLVMVMPVGHKAKETEMHHLFYCIWRQC